MARSVDLQHKVLQDADHIPPLPQAVVRTIALLNDPETEPEHIEAVLCNDHVLVGRLLSLVNSPFYGMRREITDIRGAVMVLGFQGLRSMVMMTSTAKFLKRDYSCYGYESNGLWKCSVAVAAGARYLAKELGDSPRQAEEVFVAGLLHDVGKMVLAPHSSELADAALAEFDGRLAAERHCLGIDYAEAGGLVAGKWSLPSMVFEVIAKRHGDLEELTFAREARIVRVAVAEAAEMGVGYLPSMAPKVGGKLEDLMALGIADPQETSGGMQDAVRAALDGLATLAG